MIKTVADLIEALASLPGDEPVRILTSPRFLDGVKEIRHIHGRSVLVPNNSPRNS